MDLRELFPHSPPEGPTRQYAKSVSKYEGTDAHEEAWHAKSGRGKKVPGKNAVRFG
jgi:hypothetical protein